MVEYIEKKYCVLSKAKSTFPQLVYICSVDLYYNLYPLCSHPSGVQRPIFLFLVFSGEVQKQRLTLVNPRCHQLNYFYFFYMSFPAKKGLLPFALNEVKLCRLPSSSHV